MYIFNPTGAYLIPFMTFIKTTNNLICDETLHSDIFTKIGITNKVD